MGLGHLTIDPCDPLLQVRLLGPEPFVGFLANGLKAKPAVTALAELEDLEDSQGKDILAELLKHGVAYHNADLDWDQRDVIERGFRKNEIMIVCATTTLAVGLNLPARNVFIDPFRWEHDKTGRWITIPISQAEYENTSGRAGRLGLEEEFGRAVIVAPSEFDKDTYLDAYVSGSLRDVEPALAGVPLAQHVLNLVASRICRDEREIADILLASYTGILHWRGNGKEEGFNEKLKGALECEKLLGRTEGKRQARFTSSSGGSARMTDGRIEHLREISRTTVCFQIQQEK